MLHHTQAVVGSDAGRRICRQNPHCTPAQARTRRPFSSSCSASSSSTGRSRRVAVHASSQGDRSGPSGLNVGGFAPTSPSGWDVMRQTLQEAGVKMVSPQEMIFAAERDTIIVIDVRPEGDYDKGHIPDALNIPFYRPITGWEPFKIARRVGYALFGVMNGTEVNPNFAEEVREVLQGSDKTVVLYCSQGGVLESTEVHKRGWQTRSLVAAFDLTRNGLSNVQVLRDGYTGWTNSGRDIEILEYADEGTEELAPSGSRTDRAVNS